MTGRGMAWIAALLAMLLVGAFAQPGLRVGERINRPALGRAAAPRATPPLVPPPSAATLAEVTTPVTRAQGIAALMADNATKTQLDVAVRGTGLTPSQLATRTLSGKAIPAVAPAPTPTDALPTIDELDWDNGVFFSPLRCPHYQEDGQEYAVGAWRLDGLCAIPGYDIEAQHSDDVLLFGATGSAICLSLDLPPGPATYLITVKLTPKEPDALREWLAALGTETGVGMRVWGVPPRPDLAALPRGSGFVGVATIQPHALALDGDGLPRVADTIIWVECREGHEFGTMALFGGITVMRL